jgi:ABC-2 type transport system ATP-binding protein
MSIKVEQLTKNYGDQAAVDSLNFEVAKGQICGFLGPNGAGKTTTMKILSCFTIPSSGHAYVAGYDVEKDPYAVRMALGYLPEHNPLYRNMYVKEYLHFIGRLFKLKNRSARVADMIEMTGLTREQHKPINALSKGYRQRVGLAQAMIHDPEVLILDEPTSGLDPNQLADIRQLILQLGSNKTVLFSSHIMQEVEAICDRIIIINQGKLVADETKDVLKQRIQGSQQIDVMFEKAPLKADLEKINGVVRVDRINNRQYSIWSDQERDMRKDLFLYASQNGYIILEMKKSDVSVESVFQQLTAN